MRICVCVHQFPARSETFVWEQVTGLAERGHDVTVISRSVGTGISRRELAEIDSLRVNRIYLGDRVSAFRNRVVAFWRVVRHPTMGRFLLERNRWPLGQRLLALDTVMEVARHKPDVVHVHFGTLAARIVEAASFTDEFPPVVATWHGYDANAMPYTMGRNIYERLFSSDVCHTVGSGFMWNRLLNLGAIDAHLRLIPMGIDLRRFPFRYPEPANNPPLRVISVGRLDEMKGHTYLIDACAMLNKETPQVTLRIIGDGRQSDALERQIAENGLEQSVTLVGSLPPDSVAQELSASHVFALTGIEAENGKVEAQGVVFAEAQAVGLPVIASRVGGVVDSVIDRTTGFLTPPKNPEAIAKALTYFIEHPQEITTFGMAGRRFVEQSFSRDKMLDRIEELLSDRCQQSSHVAEPTTTCRD